MPYGKFAAGQARKFNIQNMKRLAVFYHEQGKLFDKFERAKARRRG